jgi:hypothetical protein
MLAARNSTVHQFSRRVWLGSSRAKSVAVLVIFERMIRSTDHLISRIGRTYPAQLSNNRGASRSVEFLGESDEKPFRPADVAEPIRVLISDYFAYELCAALAKPAKRLVDVVHGEHDAEVA